MGKNTATYTYDTFSDLRLTIGDSSSSITVLGGTALNDGRGGRFYYNTTSSAPDDDLNIIKPITVSGQGRWIRSTPRVTKQDVGLGNVDNTSDIDKPVSTDQNIAITNAISTANGYSDSKIATLSVSEVRAISNNPPAQLATTDYGGGIWYMDNSDTTSADNTGTILVTSNGKRYKRIYDGTNVYVEWFGAKGDGIADDTNAIQLAINSDASAIRLNGQYLVTDIISVALKNNISILLDPSAKVFTNKHGWGVFDITQSTDVVISGGTLQGVGVFPDKTYSGGPDGEAGTGDGGGEKHYIGGTWGFNRNGDATGRPTFSGGIIGNCGVGILVHVGCKNVTIDGIDISGFNYQGVGVGWRGDSATDRLNFSKNITVTGCYIHDCYNSGVEMHSVDGAKIINNYIERIGHPDAIGTDITIDPGYGTALTAVSNDAHTSRNVIIDNNIIIDCKRKNIDSHSSEVLIISKNILKTSFVQGVALTGNSGGRSKCIVTNNVLTDCGIGNIAGSVVDAKIGIYSAHENTQVSENQLYNCGMAYAINTLRESTTIKDNIIESLDTTGKAATYAGVYMTAGTNCMVEGNIVTGIFNRAFVFGNGAACTFSGNTMDLSLATAPDYVIFNSSNVTIGRNKLPKLQRITGNNIPPLPKVLNFLFTYVSGQADATVAFLSGDNIPYTITTGGVGTGVVLDIGYDVLAKTASLISYNTTRNAGNPQTFTVQTIASSRYISVFVSPRDAANAVLASSSGVMNGTKIFLQVTIGDLI